MPKKRKAPTTAKGAAVETWKDEPDAHDFPAAASYLSLLLHEETAASLVERLKGADKIDRQAKDLLRASRLPLLSADNVHVAADLQKVSAGERLSPVLLIRGQAEIDRPLLVADGYHRICASYHLNEDAEIPCRLVDLT